MNIGPSDILSFCLVAYSIILHEIAHGYAALKFGDTTAKDADRITLNPIPHVDMFGTVLFPLIQLLMPPHRVMLGWAKPVPVQTHNLEPRIAGEIVVSIAGVAVNFAIALAMSILLGFPVLVRPESQLENVLFGVMVANIGLGIFNLVPIPPLDGSHVAKYFLPEGLRRSYEQIGFYGTIILLVLISNGALRPIIGPPIAFLVELLWHNVSMRLRGAL